MAAQLARLTALDESWHDVACRDALHRRRPDARRLCCRASGRHLLLDHRPPAARSRSLPQARQERADDDPRPRRLCGPGRERLAGADGFPRDMWRDLGPSERFYVRMLDMEAKGATKVADFQNFAKSFAFADYADLMASTAANAASLAGAADLKGRMLDGDGFAKTPDFARFCSPSGRRWRREIPSSASPLCDRVCRRLLAAPTEADRPCRVHCGQDQDNTARRERCRARACRSAEARSGVSHGDRALLVSRRRRSATCWRSGSLSATRYLRIAGYFRSSLLEVVGEALDTVGEIRVVCNGDLDPYDVKVAKAARDGHEALAQTLVSSLAVHRRRPRSAARARALSTPA